MSKNGVNLDRDCITTKKTELYYFYVQIEKSYMLNEGEIQKMIVTN